MTESIVEASTELVVDLAERERALIQGNKENHGRRGIGRNKARGSNRKRLLKVMKIPIEKIEE